MSDSSNDMQIELFETMMFSVLTKTSEISGYNIVRDLESLHMKFLK